MNYPLLALAIYSVTITGLAAYAGNLLRQYAVKSALFLFNQGQAGQEKLGKSLAAYGSLQSQANAALLGGITGLTDRLHSLELARVTADSQLSTALDATVDQSIHAHHAAAEAYTAVAEGVQKSLGTHQDLHALVETNMRDLRGRATGGGAKDICALCGKETPSWFINGKGQSVCPECHPAGWADARRRGTAHEGQ